MKQCSLSSILKFNKWLMLLVIFPIYQIEAILWLLQHNILFFIAAQIFAITGIMIGIFYSNVINLLREIL